MPSINCLHILHEVINHYPEYDALLNKNADAILTDFEFVIVQLLGRRREFNP